MVNKPAERTWSRARWGLVVGALLAWTTPAAVRAVDLWTPYAGDYEVSLDFGGRQRPYLVFVPKVIKYGGTMPLVIVLHGGGGHAASAVMRSRMNEAAEKKGFIAVYPNGTGRLKLKLLTWNAGPCCGYAAREQADDVGFIRALINWLEVNRPVTPGAVFVAGMSNGAMLCHRLGCELAEKISAIAVVAGSFSPDERCKPARPVPVILFNGTDDRYVPYRSIKNTVDFWVKRNGCFRKPETKRWGKIRRDTYAGGKESSEVVLYTINDGGHAWPGGAKDPWLRGDTPTTEISASELMLDFFLKHARKP